MNSFQGILKEQNTGLQLGKILNQTENTYNSFLELNCCGIGGLFGLCQNSAENGEDIVGIKS